MSEATLSVQAAELARLSEDWLAVIIGVGIFALALFSLAGLDALGWLATTSVWTDPAAALLAGLAIALARLVLLVLLNRLAPLQ